MPITYQGKLLVRGGKLATSLDCCCCCCQTCACGQCHDFQATASVTTDTTTCTMYFSGAEYTLPLGGVPEECVAEYRTLTLVPCGDPAFPHYSITSLNFGFNVKAGSPHYCEWRVFIVGQYYEDGNPMPRSLFGEMWLGAGTCPPAGTHTIALFNDTAVHMFDADYTL
jgi:hypothetical protein